MLTEYDALRGTYGDDQRERINNLVGVSVANLCAFVFVFHIGTMVRPVTDNDATKAVSNIIGQQSSVSQTI